MTCDICGLTPVHMDEAIGFWHHVFFAHFYYKRNFKCACGWTDPRFHLVLDFAKHIEESGGLLAHMAECALAGGTK